MMSISDLRTELADLTIKLLAAEELKKADMEAHKDAIKQIKGEIDDVAAMYKEELNPTGAIKFKSA